MSFLRYPLELTPESARLFNTSPSMLTLVRSVVPTMVQITFPTVPSPVGILGNVAVSGKSHPTSAYAVLRITGMIISERSIFFMRD
jgi:hypothetical protein